MVKDYEVGNRVFCETISGELDSFVVTKIVNNRLYDENGDYITKAELLSEEDPRVVKYKRKHPIKDNTQDSIPQNMDFVSKAALWLEEQAGKVITKKLINEFKNFMNYDQI